jgi:ubiquinone/menaquinone biosynthesis C-methylase UbiE
VTSAADNHNANQEETNVGALFDEMADEYDDISDFWYAWLFSRLHYLVSKSLAGIKSHQHCLDVGCGTGFQTTLIALFGHDVVGIDIAGELLRRAKRKQPADYLMSDLFASPFTFVRKYSESVRQYAVYGKGENHVVGDAMYCQASATSLPFQSETRDVIVCCGSTLNFIDQYMLALKEMYRVLRPGGLLIIEVENRYNLDLLWALIESVLPIKLGFEQDLKTSLRNLRAPAKEHVLIDYPFETHSNTTLHMPLRLFSAPGFKRDLQSAGFEILKTHGIHSVTNLLPITWLHTASPGWVLRSAAVALASLEKVVGGFPGIRHLGCSVVYWARKIVV